MGRWERGRRKPGAAFPVTSVRLAMRSHRLRKRVTGLGGRTTRIITPCNGARQSSTFPPVRTDAPSYRPIRLKSPKRSLQASGRSQASLWNGFALHCYALQNMLNSLTRPTMAGSRRNGALFSAWPMCRRERRGRLPCCIPRRKKGRSNSDAAWITSISTYYSFARPHKRPARSMTFGSLCFSISRCKGNGSSAVHAAGNSLSPKQTIKNIARTVGRK